MIYKINIDLKNTKHILYCKCSSVLSHYLTCYWCDNVRCEHFKTCNFICPSCLIKGKIIICNIAEIKIVKECSCFGNMIAIKSIKPSQSYLSVNCTECSYDSVAIAFDENYAGYSLNVDFYD